MSNASRPRYAAVALVVLALGLAGCAERGTGPTPVDAAPSVSPVPSPTQTPEAQPIIVPDCADLVPTEFVQNVSNFERYEPGTVGWTPPTGPAAEEALANAVQYKKCSWGIPSSDAVAYVYVAELIPESRETFIKALDESDFVKTVVEGNPTYLFEGGIQNSALHWWYGFHGNIVVADFSFFPESQLGNKALQAMTSVISP